MTALQMATLVTAWIETVREETERDTHAIIPESTMTLAAESAQLCTHREAMEVMNEMISARFLKRNFGHAITRGERFEEGLKVVLTTREIMRALTKEGVS